MVGGGGPSPSLWPPLGHTISGADLDLWYQQARAAAIAAAIDPAEVEWLILEITSLDRLSLRLGQLGQRPTIPSRQSFQELQDLWQRRLVDRTPVQYLVGHTQWRHLTLQVTPDVLIPRPETELIVDLALEAARHQGTDFLAGAWVDVGTGSGAIALGLAQALPRASIYAIDTSPAALAVAQANARYHQLDSRLTWRLGSWLEPLADLRGLVAAIVTNPPYIPSQVVLTLDPEVRCHEPVLALDGGQDGLDAIRELVRQAPAYLCAGGLWITELMQGQAPTVAALLEQSGNYRDIAIHPDLSGIERFVLAHRH